MKEQDINQKLHGLAAEAVPDDVNLWPALRARLRPHTDAAAGKRLLPATRLGWALLVGSLIVILGSTAYALGPSVWEVLWFWQPIEKAQLGQEMQLSQAHDGITVTLERSYADANQILVGYTVDGMTDAHMGPGQLTLTDDRGNVFPEGGGAGVTGASDLLGVSLAPGEGSFVTSFDASGVEGAPDTLHLRLSLQMSRSTPVDMPVELPTPEDDSTSVIIAPAQMMRVEPVGEPFSFEFDVPFVPGHAIDTPQTVDVNGVAVTLQRAVVSPSEVRATVCFARPVETLSWWAPVGTLDAGPGQELMGSGSNLISEADGVQCHRWSFFFSSIPDMQGEWTLSVDELVGEDPSPGGQQVRVAGPWVFEFLLP